jgi:hypothetical protein
MQRRRWLKLGLGTAAVLGLAGGLAARLEPAMSPHGQLSLAGREALGAISKALLADALPAEGLEAHLDAFERTVATFPLEVRAELRQLLSLTTSAAGRLGLFGSAGPLHELSQTELQAHLQALRFSKLALRQQAYFALRDLTFAAHFGQAQSWSLMGYPGPRPIG